MHQTRVAIGITLIVLSALAIFGGINNYYRSCLSPTAGIGPAYDRCGSAEAALQYSFVFTPVMAVGIYLLICGAKELSLMTLRKKA